MNKVLFLAIITACIICILGYSQNRLHNFSLSKPLNNALHSFSITKSDIPSFLEYQQEQTDNNTLSFNNKTVSKMPIIKPKGDFNIPNYYSKNERKKVF